MAGCVHFSTLCVVFIILSLHQQAVSCRDIILFKDESKNVTVASGIKCHYGDGLIGRCETFSSCQPQKGGFIKKENAPNKCRVNSDIFEVCCRRPYVIAKELCRSWRTYWTSNQGQCIEETPLIVGGEEAIVGQFPEIGIVGYVDSSNTKHWQCGANLVSAHFAITAAHCVLRRRNFIIKFGEHDLFRPNVSPTPRIVGAVPFGLYRSHDLEFETRNHAPTEQTIAVSNVIIHPDYQKTYHDIALLELKSPVVFTRRVLPACLPFTQDSHIGIGVTAAGWGKLSFGKSKLSRTLQKVKIPIIDRQSCQEKIAALNARLLPQGVLEGQMCSGSLGKDTCKGDSGGPVVAQITNLKTPCEHTLLGVVSLGPGCGIIGVNTRVSSYVDWIIEHISPKAAPNIQQ